MNNYKMNGNNQNNAAIATASSKKSNESTNGRFSRNFDIDSDDEQNANCC